MAEKPIAWIFLCCLWAGPVWGVSVVPQIDCPVQFRAIASEVREEAGHALSRSRVTFTVEEAVKGVGDESQFSVELLKFGPLTVAEGKQYDVQLNNGKLCWIEEVGSAL